MDTTCPVCGSLRKEAETTCAACGFRFIEATQQFAPISSQPSQTAQTTNAPHPLLRVIRGPQTGVVYELTNLVSSVGRNPQCDIFLNDMTVSREHALIAATERGYVITDRKSYNGVWINNKEVDTKVLQPGDVIQIGTFCLVFES